MKKITQKFLFALALSVVAMPAMAQFATPTSFTPAPMGEENPLRFFVNLQPNMMFSAVPGNPVFADSPAGKFGLGNFQLSLGLIYNVGMGLDVGFGVHGGLYSPYGLFATPDSTVMVSPYTQYGAMFGIDVMARYLAMFSDLFYGGLQAQVGYDYTNLLPGSPDSLYTTYSKGSQYSFIPVMAGLVLGMNFADAACFYLFPGIELGQTGNYTNSVDNKASSPDRGVWKSAMGMQIAVGTAIDLGATKLVLEVKPRMANFSNKYSWGMDATLGAFWDF